MKNSEKIIPILSFFWLITLGVLGVWWMYIIEKMGHQISHLHHLLSKHHSPLNISRMIYWEGGFFLILTLVLFVTLIILFLNDHRKNKAIHAFFASVAHELKNPLASIKLQAEMVEELHAEQTEKQLLSYIGKIQTSTNLLEEQIDNLLQLSRIELRAPSHLTTINLSYFLKHFLLAHSDKNITFDSSLENADILVDELGLKIILRNLLENSQRHASGLPTNIQLLCKPNKIILTYTNHNQYTGDPKQLGKLFYKFNSPNGSGIGIYIIKELMKKMDGNLTVQTVPYLEFKLSFAAIGEDNNE